MTFLDYLSSFFFGIVEGITEWLPISSTGHMILLNELLPLSVSAEFLELYMVVIQLGAVMAVVCIYWEKLWPISFKNGIALKDGALNLWLKIAVACVPAVIVGVFFDDALNEIFYNWQTVAIALVVFGVLFILVENKNKNIKPKCKSLQALTYRAAIIIGLYQMLAAIFPGTSRSGATILGALIIGVSRSVAAEFTFFLSVPVMFGASLLKLVKFEGGLSGGELGMLAVGLITAFVVSIFAIRFLIGYVKKNDFKPFGWYRIVLGLVVIVAFTFFI